MDRPSRHRKTVNYSDFLDDDDEDFATVKVPPSKKPRVSVVEPQHEKNRKTAINSAKVTDLTDISGKGCRERVSLDDKLYNRDLEAALTLSLLQSTETGAEPLASGQDFEKPPVLMPFSADSSSSEQDKSSGQQFQDLPPVLSNCSVDVSELGLDQIISDQSPDVSSQRRPSDTLQRQRPVLQEDGAGDEDYNPQHTPESNTGFSDPEESEDEDYTAKRKGEREKPNKNERKTAPKALKKEKRPVKSAKAKSQSTVLSRSPAVAQGTLKTTPTTPLGTNPTLCSSPTEGRRPKWNPPGLVGQSPSACLSGPVRSPGSGLRLGLSRLARVKPLHPNTAAH